MWISKSRFFLVASVCVHSLCQQGGQTTTPPAHPQDLFGGLQDRKLSPDQADLATEKLGEVGRRNEEGLRHGFGTRIREELLAADVQRRDGRVTAERCALRSGTGGPPARVIAERSVLRGVTGGPPANDSRKGRWKPKGEETLRIPREPRAAHPLGAIQVPNPTQGGGGSLSVFGHSREVELNNSSPVAQGFGRQLGQ